MNIHVVQPGETIYSIAQTYGVPATRLIQDNDLFTPNNLVIGQAIVIAYPKQTYTVQDGDSLISIANAHSVTLMQLLRNNPHLSDRKIIYPGETIVISYNNNKGTISIDGYAYPFIDKNILRKTLPFLTYLSVFNYRTMADAKVISMNDDTEIIQIAKEYGVAPIMFTSTLTTLGESSWAAAYKILNNPELVDRHIDNILYILKTKGYYGLNITFQFINAENVLIYNNYIIQLYSRLNKEGYSVAVTLNPGKIVYGNQITFERVDYSVIGQNVDSIMLMSYNWGYSYGPPGPSTNVFLEREFFNYIIALIPPEKIYTGIPIVGYDWKLPYEIGISKANSLTTTSALELASEVGAIIQFDEMSQAPFFKYVEKSSEIPAQHEVWFKDGRSIDAILKLVSEYGFEGVGIWNIMNYFTQMWLVINSQVEIKKVLPELFTHSE